MDMGHHAEPVARAGSHPDVRVSKRQRTETDTSLRRYGWTPLHYAAVHGNIDRISELIRTHAEGHSVVRGTLLSGATPLHFAAMCGHVAPVRLLLSGCMYDDITQALFMASHPVKMEMSRGWTSPSEECISESYGALETQRGPDDPGFLPLDLACLSGAEDVVALLLESMHQRCSCYRSGVACAVDCQLPTHMSPDLLLEVARRQHIPVALALLSYRAPYENADACGFRPIHWAACHGNLELVKILLDHGADPLARTYDNKTCMELAAIFHGDNPLLLSEMYQIFASCGEM